jgi:dsRNA-specific ribonuclease
MEMMVDNGQLGDEVKMKQFKDFIESGDENIKEVLKRDIAMFNFQRLEYLGDSILNFSLAKLFYLDTVKTDYALDYRQVYYSEKLHVLKTQFGSNHWLAMLICEHYYFSM